MARRSAGILVWKRVQGSLFVLLVHPGGPFWQKRDTAAWSIPKGEYDDEWPEAAARREFAEETGLAATGVLQPLGEVRQSGGKRVAAFALEDDFDTANIRSNMCEMEWPPHSGLRRAFPEVDRAAWFPLELARDKIVAGQRPFLDRLEATVAKDPD